MEDNLWWKTTFACCLLRFVAFFREKEQKSHFKVQSPSKLNTFDLTFFFNSSCSCSYCDREKTKSTPSLGLEVMIDNGIEQDSGLKCSVWRGFGLQKRCGVICTV